MRMTWLSVLPAVKSSASVLRAGTGLSMSQARAAHRQVNVWHWLMWGQSSLRAIAVRLHFSFEGINSACVTLVEKRSLCASVCWLTTSDCFLPATKDIKGFPMKYANGDRVQVYRPALWRKGNPNPVSGQPWISTLCFKETKPTFS